jgi:hypothetical protein
MFSVEDAAVFFGIRPSSNEMAALAEVPFSKETLKACKDSHVLVAVLGVVIFCYGLLFLLVSLGIVLAMSVITIIILMNDFRSLNGQMPRILHKDAEAYSFSPLQMINWIIIGLNGILIAVVLLCYLTLPGSCSAEGHAEPHGRPPPSLNDFQETHSGNRSEA